MSDGGAVCTTCWNIKNCSKKPAAASQRVAHVETSVVDVNQLNRSLTPPMITSIYPASSVSLTGYRCHGASLTEMEGVINFVGAVGAQNAALNSVDPSKDLIRSEGR